MRFTNWKTTLIPTVLFIITAVIYYLSSPGPSPYDHFVRLADALVHGRLNIDPCPEYLEHMIFAGRCYYVFPPLPAIILLPAVLFKGLAIDQRLFTIIIAALTAPLYWWGLSHLNKTKRLWLILLICFGTVLWFLASVGSSWYFAQIVGFIFASAAVFVAMKKKSLWLASTLYGLSTLARLPLIPGFIFFPLYFSPSVTLARPMVMLASPASHWDSGCPRRDVGVTRMTNRIITLLKLTLPFLLCISVYLGYNFARFGTVGNVAYTQRVGLSSEPWFDRGLIHPSYIARHLKVLFLQLPKTSTQPPWLVPDFYGLSIWFTTPALLLVFKAGLNRKNAPFWIGALAVLLTNMLHGGVGFTQFGYRFLVDSFPFLIPLFAQVIEKRIDWVTKVLIILSILFNLWGIVTINFLKIW